jgi:predicted TIM-barrel fold metal-dependent hydrolase
MQRAVDSHAHVLSPDHPLAENRLFTPHPSQMGTGKDFLAVLDAHGFSHGLAVGAQCYMHDNSCLLDAIAASGGRLKGIALVLPGTSESALDRLAEGGVVGIRFNTTAFGVREFAEPGADRLLAQVKERGWFLQIHCEHDELAEAMPYIRRAGVTVMIDHFGRPEIGSGLAQKGFAALLELGRAGGHVVKLSGPFRSSEAGYPYEDVDAFVAAAIDAFTLDRCVWGSDWPYLLMNRRMDYGPPLACLARWLPDANDRKKVLWENPARLFGFA